MDMKVSDMLEMQRRLQERYAGIWAKLTPEQGAHQLLWAICEMGEVADIIKKKAPSEIMSEGQVREAFKEELADVLMYLGDIMLCYGISADEMSRAYADKHEYNMRRRYEGVAHYEKDGE